MNTLNNFSDIFGRFLVVAGYLPALALLTLIQLLIVPGLPPEIQQQLSLIRDMGYMPDFTILLIVPVFLAAILVSLTDTTVQIYSGSPLFQPGEELPEKYQEFSELVKQMEERMKWLQNTDPGEDPELKDKVNAAIPELQSLIVDLKKMTGGVIFLSPRSLHNTRLGNVFAALNEYPGRRYGMNAGAIWARLKSILPEEFDERLKSQNTSFMFMLNLSVCCVFFAALWVVFGAASLAGWAQVNRSVWAVVMILACAGVYLFYRGAVAEAFVLVESMMTAFDLFRGDLLEKLGLPRPPTLREEKIVWSTLTSFLVLGDEQFDLPKSSSSEAK